MLNADITGLMAQAVEGWQDAVKTLAVPEGFDVRINPKADVLSKLNDSQKTRLFRKLKLVKFAAQCMAAGMLKGTLKYATDTYTMEQWIAHLVGEGADQMNYQLLLADKYQESQAAAKTPTVPGEMFLGVAAKPTVGMAEGPPPPPGLSKRALSMQPDAIEEWERKADIANGFPPEEAP